MRRAFGLLETVVAIAVITTGLFAVFTLVFTNLRASDAARLRFGGVQVAREGVEVVRMIRDANWVNLERGQPQYADLPTADSDATTHAVAVFAPEARNKWSMTVLPVDATIDLPKARIVRTNTPWVVFWTQGDESADADATFYRRLITLRPICRVENSLPTESDTIILRDLGESCAMKVPVLDRIGTLVSSTAQWTDDGRIETATVEEELYEWR